MADKNLVITEQGLIKVSKELINKRTFDSTKITTVGTPLINDGVGSAFSTTSYFQKSSLDFSDADSIKLDIVGTFMDPSTSQTSYYKDGFITTGSPTITDAGIASGFGNGVGVSADIAFPSSTSITFKGEVIYNSEANAASGTKIFLATGLTSEGSLVRIGINNTGTYLQLDGLNGVYPQIALNRTLQTGDVIDYEFTFTNTSLTSQLTVNDVSVVNDTRAATIDNVASAGTRNCVLNNSSIAQNYYWTGSVDLSKFQVTADNISIFSGSYIPQCLYSLHSTSSIVSDLYVQIYPNKIELCLGSTPIAVLAQLSYSSYDTVNLSLTLTNSTFEITYLNGITFSTSSGSLIQEIDLADYSILTLGNLNETESNYWLGSIDLANVLLFKNDSLYYAPSNEPEFRFTKFMIGDGSIPLTDASEPVLNHIYEFSVDELKRTANSILLKGTIGEDVYLNIAEIGLYSTGDDGTVLFSLVDGLAIKKTSDLDYNLIFIINLDMNVVNTVAMPDFAFTEDEKGVFRDFLTIKQVFDYMLTNLERIINMNAKQLGYDQIQTVWQTQNKLELWEDNFNSTQAYTKLRNVIKPFTTYVYNSNKIAKIGSPSITSAGDMSSISTSNYATLSQTPYNTSIDNFDLSLKFKTASTLSTSQIITNFYANTHNQPLEIGINANNQCYLKAGAQETLNATINTDKHTFIRVGVNDRVINSVQYYAWYNSSGIVVNNPHVTIVGSPSISSGAVADFSTSNYVYIPTNVTLTDDFTLQIPISTPATSSSVQTIISGSSNYYLKITLGTNNKLSYSIGNGTAWTNTVTGTNTLSASTYYIIRLTFDGTEYKGYIVDAAGTTTQDCDIITTTTIPSFQLRIGLDNAGANPWLGLVDLTKASIEVNSIDIWNGTYSSSTVFTNTNSPTTASSLYDESGTIFVDTSITAVSRNQLISTSLFNISQSATYYLKVNFDGTRYLIQKSTDGINYTSVYLLPSAVSINPFNKVYLGVGYNSTSAIQPFLGTLYLGEYKLTVNGTEISPLTYTSTVADTKDFYSFSNYPFSCYTVKNLNGDSSSVIDYIEGSITGRNDSIDFSNSNGFTICIKAYLQDTEDKIILNKINIDEDETYFSLKFVNDTLVFNLYLEDSTVELTSLYSPIGEYRKYLDNPVSIFVTCENTGGGRTYRLYRNNTLIDLVSSSSTDYLTASNYVLTNYDSNSVATTNYVEEIISFEGALSATDIYFVNNILDTNF